MLGNNANTTKFPLRIWKGTDSRSLEIIEVTVGRNDIANRKEKKTTQ